MPLPLDTDDDVVLLVPEEETVPEHDTHRILVDALAAGLVARFAGRDDVAVFCRLAWFPDRDDTRIRLDPDVMVVFGRPPGPRKSYKAWMEDNVAPAVLVEVVSDEDTAADYRRRFARARRYGVREIVTIDPFAPGGSRVEHLVADVEQAERFRTVATSSAAGTEVVVASLGIRLEGGPALAVRDNGTPWPTTAEAFILARTEGARADSHADRADTEAARADAEAARAARLTERLLAAGFDPDDT